MNYVFWVEIDDYLFVNYVFFIDFYFLFDLHDGKTFNTSILL